MTCLRGILEVPERCLRGALEVPQKYLRGLLGDLEGLDTLSGASEAPGALRGASEVEVPQRCLRGPSEAHWRCRRKALEVPWRCLVLLEVPQRSLTGALDVP